MLPPQWEHKIVFECQDFFFHVYITSYCWMFSSLDLSNAAKSDFNCLIVKQVRKIKLSAAKFDFISSKVWGVDSLTTFKHCQFLVATVLWSIAGLFVNMLQVFLLCLNVEETYCFLWTESAYHILWAIEFHHNCMLRCCQVSQRHASSC